MQDIFELYQYLKDNYHNYKKIIHTEKEILIVFHDEFEMKIKVQNYFNLYFNNIFYYNLDWQDVKDTIDDLLNNHYAFCEKNNKIKIVKLEELCNSAKYTHIWTIEKTLK